MRIEVIRSGGFAGIERRGSLDTATRPDAPHLTALAEAALTAASPHPPRGVPDGFLYELRADGRTGFCADPAVTAAQRELIGAVLGRP